MRLLNQYKIIALLFLALTFLFLVVSMTNQTFFDWIFARHQNQWSWYIRPVFLIPFCFFAFKHNWIGISITVCCLFTSMFWFNKPALVNDDVKAFLQFEKDWLYGEWNYKKIMLFITVPVSFFVIGYAFWKRSLIIGLIVLVLVAAGKIVWSIHNAGESGKSIIAPAILGLLICIGLIWYGFKKIEKNN